VCFDCRNAGRLRYHVYACVRDERSLLFFRGRTSTVRRRTRRWNWTRFLTTKRSSIASVKVTSPTSFSPISPKASRKFFRPIASDDLPQFNRFDINSLFTTYTEVVNSTLASLRSTRPCLWRPSLQCSWTSSGTVCRRTLHSWTGHKTVLDSREDVFMWAVGPKRSVNPPLMRFRSTLPISNLVTISKVLERLALNRLRPRMLESPLYS